eukprot:Hpha_TRINITY_DN16140_c0_g10::TRINITY_DN16140_c0_g10_i1::g.8635::m.8635
MSRRSQSAQQPVRDMSAFVSLSGSGSQARSNRSSRSSGVGSAASSRQGGQSSASGSKRDSSVGRRSGTQQKPQNRSNPSSRSTTPRSQASRKSGWVPPQQGGRSAVTAPQRKPVAPTSVGRKASQLSAASTRRGSSERGSNEDRDYGRNEDRDYGGRTLSNAALSQIQSQLSAGRAPSNADLGPRTLSHMSSQMSRGRNAPTVDAVDLRPRQPSFRGLQVVTLSGSEAEAQEGLGAEHGQQAMSPQEMQPREARMQAVIDGLAAELDKQRDRLQVTEQQLQGANSEVSRMRELSVRSAESRSQFSDEPASHAPQSGLDGSQLGPIVTQERARNAILETELTQLRVRNIRLTKEAEAARADAKDASAEADAFLKAKQKAEAACAAAERCLLDQNKHLGEKQQATRRNLKRAIGQRERSAGALNRSRTHGERRILFTLWIRHMRWRRLRRRSATSLRRRAVLSMVHRHFSRLLRWAGRQQSQGAKGQLEKGDRERLALLQAEGADPYTQAAIDVLDEAARDQERRIADAERRVEEAVINSEVGLSTGRRSVRSRTVSPVRSMSPRQKRQIADLLCREEDLEARLASAEEAASCLSLSNGGRASCLTDDIQSRRCLTDDIHSRRSERRTVKFDESGCVMSAVDGASAVSLATNSRPEVREPVSPVAVAAWAASMPEADAFTLALAQAGDVPAFFRLREAAFKAETVSIGELLRGDVEHLLRVSTASPEGALLRLDAEQTVGLADFLAGRGATGPTAVAKYLSSPQWRWELWKNCTVQEFIDADGSHPCSRPGGQLTLRSAAPALCLSAAAAASADHSARKARRVWRTGADVGTVAVDSDIRCSEVEHDFFKLTVLELLQRAIAVRAVRRQAEVRQALEMVFPQGVMGAFAGSLRAIAHEAPVIVLVSPQSAWVRREAQNLLREVWDGVGMISPARDDTVMLLYDSGRLADTTPRGGLSFGGGKDVFRILLSERKRSGGTVEILAADLKSSGPEFQRAMDRVEDCLRTEQPRGCRLLAGRWGLDLLNPEQAYCATARGRRRYLDALIQASMHAGLYAASEPPSCPRPTLFDDFAPSYSEGLPPVCVLGSGLCAPAGQGSCPLRGDHLLAPQLSSAVESPAGVGLALQPQPTPHRSPSATPTAPVRTRSPPQPGRVSSPTQGRSQSPFEEVHTDADPRQIAQQLVVRDDGRIVSVSTEREEEEPPVRCSRWEPPPEAKRVRSFGGVRGGSQQGVGESAAPSDPLEAASPEADALRTLRFQVSRLVEELGRVTTDWQQHADGFRLSRPPAHIAALPATSPALSTEPEGGLAGGLDSESQRIAEVTRFLCELRARAL